MKNLKRIFSLKSTSIICVVSIHFGALSIEKGFRLKYTIFFFFFFDGNDGGKLYYTRNMKDNRNA